MVSGVNEAQGDQGRNVEKTCEWVMLRGEGNRGPRMTPGIWTVSLDG